MKIRVPPHLALPLVLSIAFVARGAWAYLCSNEPISDQQVYHSAAVMISQGRGFVDESGDPINYWPVGYPALLGAFYAAFGATYRSAFLLNLSLSLVMILGIYKLGERLFGPRVGLLSALLLALYPSSILYTTLFVSENPFIAGLPWALLATVRAIREHDRWLRFALQAGVWIGLLAYVRPPALLLLLCPVAFAMIERAPVKRALLSTVLVASTTFAVLTPWGVRNLHEFGRFSVVADNGGANLWIGNGEGADGAYRNLPAEIGATDAASANDVLTRSAVRFILEHPLNYAALCLKRIAITLRSDTSGVEWNRIGIERRFGASGVGVLKIVCSLAHWTLLAGVLLTLVRHIRLRAFSRTDLELMFFVSVLCLPFVLIVGGNRYMLPAVPFLILWLVSAQISGQVKTRVEDVSRFRSGPRGWRMSAAIDR